MRHPKSSLILSLSILFNLNNVAVAFPRTSKASTNKQVFGHYLAGTATQEHAVTDIQDAVSMGLDGFVLNVGNPIAGYTNNTLEYMFDYADKQGFKLFINIDLNGAKGAGLGLYDFVPLFHKYINHPAYLQGPNGAPFISGYSDGGYTNANWTNFLASVSNKTYFVPDFDSTEGYYSATKEWWGYWGDVVDGLFSWESMWPQDPTIGPGQAYPGDTSLDEIVIAGTAKHHKSYMVGLSTLQYKDAYSTNLYREGGLNLPVRIENILNMSPAPDFAQIHTWNNGPESHYMGNLWPEANDDYQASLYSGLTWDHTAWQPIYTSFINTFKAKLPASKMAPPPERNLPAVGSLWYKTILQNQACNNVTYNGTDSTTNLNTTGCPPNVADSCYYYEKPRGYANGTDALNWAVVLDPQVSSKTYTLQGISNGKVLGEQTLKSGLNYGAFGGIQPGAQSLRVLDASGNVVLATEAGRRGVNETCTSIYNMNYEVVQLRHPSSLRVGVNAGVAADVGGGEAKIGVAAAASVDAGAVKTESDAAANADLHVRKDGENADLSLGGSAEIHI